MKILVLQTARLGDILMTWPALRALKRTRPGAEIHLVVRPRFAAAARGLEAVDRVIELPTASILEPLMKEDGDEAEALRRTQEFLGVLRAENYHEVVNFSFSPLSSWIAKAVAAENTVVRGYTRHEDGWLKIADGVSSYFYSQVGPGRENRIHLTDLFAAQLEIDLEDEDWRPPSFEARDFGLPSDYIVLHAGASESGKTIAPFIWGRALKAAHAVSSGIHVVVIGTAAETPLANEIRIHAVGVPLTDLTGQTQFEDLFTLISNAKCLLGADSAPIHVAALTKTPCLNVSAGRVCFWETGPKSPGSFVLRFDEASPVSSDRVARALTALIEGKQPADAIAACPGIPSFQTMPSSEDFGWNLLRAIYLEADFPVTEDPLFLVAVQRLQEMNTVVLEQLEKISASSEVLGALMDRADEVFHAIARMNAHAAVLVRWIMAEKSRIPPGQKQEIRDEMARIHGQLANVLKLYDIGAAERKETGDGKI